MFFYVPSSDWLPELAGYTRCTLAKGEMQCNIFLFDISSVDLALFWSKELDNSSVISRFHKIVTYRSSTIKFV